MGYNVTSSNIGAFPMGVRCDPMSAIPYNVSFVAASLPGATVIQGNPFNVDYEILDVNDVRCLGYFTYTAATPEPTQFWSSDPAFAIPADESWDGTTVENGVVTATLVLNTAGVQWVNVSEGVAALNGPYAVDYDLTPWGAVAPALKDWDEFTVTVIGGAFQWNLVAGWNMICVPMVPIYTGGDGSFRAFDILNETFLESGDVNTQVARKSGQVGGITQYDTFDYGMPEGIGADFATDYTAGYWLYATIPDVVVVDALNLTSDPGIDDTVTIQAGEWTMLGFTHNSTWTNAPDSVYLTDGTADADLALVGAGGTAGNYLTVSWFNQGNQLYSSYVTTTWFPGMASAIWTYDTTYAFGWWIYVENAVTITFDRLY
jgi:hypothetical protein